MDIFTHLIERSVDKGPSDGGNSEQADGYQHRPIIRGMIERHKKVLIVSYGPLLIFILIASVLFSVLVASGETLFPSWVAWINPVTMTIAWPLVKRLLPQFVRDWTEGAGFNIAYMAFFLCTTLTLWNK